VCFAGATLFCYFILLQVLASSARGAGIIGQMVVFPLMMLGGSFFPFDIMPAWMAAIGRWTPNGLAVTHLRTLLFETPDLRAIALAAVLMAAPAAGAFLLSARRLRQRFAVS
jgi:ABC-type multidrug transport system permease subunit